MDFIRKIVNKSVLSLLKKNDGAVLIEFAFAIPLLVIILYFALDVPTVYRLSSKLYKTSELFAQILTNVTKNQYPQTLTLANLKDISKIVGLVFTGVKGSVLQPFILSTYVIAIKGTGGGSNKEFNVLWGVRIDDDLRRTDSPEIKINNYEHATINASSKTHGGNMENLSIQKNEIKLLVEIVANYDTKTGRGFNSGLYLMTIPGKIIGDGVRIFGDKSAVITIPEEIISQVPK
jgi:hypothetical protein